MADSDFVELNTATAIDAVINTAQAAVDPTAILEGDSTAALAFVLPNGATLDVRSIEPILAPYRAAPRRKQGTVKLSTVESLIDYLNDEAPESLTVWVHPSDGTVVGVLNDNVGLLPDPQIIARAPGWRDHRAALRLEKTAEWRFWVDSNNNGSLLPQEAFARHIERGLPDIVEPEAALMLEMAQNMHVATSANIQSAKRTMGDVQVTYTQEQTAKTGGAGQYEFPAKFEIFIAPFLGESAELLTCRTTYRVNGGQLMVGYTVDRPEAVITKCIEGLVVRLKDAHFQRVYVGTP